MILNWVGPLVLTLGEVRRIPPGVSGVYLLHTFAPHLGAYPVFYAGKSMDLRRRLVDHLGRATTKPLIRAARELDRPYFSAAPVAVPALLDRIEAGLIHLLRPVCNQQVPVCHPLAVTLPPVMLVSLMEEN